MNRLRWLLVVCLIGSVQPCVAGVTTQRQGVATLAIRYEAETPSLALADLITVTLTIEGSSALRVQAPLDLPAGAKWILVERCKVERETIDSQRVTWRIVYRFAPREPGQVAFAFPDVKIRDADIEDQVASWKKVVFTVTTQVTNLDRTGLRDITAIEALRPAIPADNSWPMGTLIASLGILLIAVLFGMRGLFRRGTPKSPSQWALYEWQRLVALNLPDQGRSERFITLLTLVLRRYLERQFNLPARRQTTPEFLHTLAHQAALGADEKRFLTTFLERCEAVKFANQTMPADECHEWAERARQFFLRRSGESAQTR